MRLAWKPSEFWAATLFELETAIWIVTPEANRPPPMTEDDSRQFFERLDQAVQE